jgi:dephospho-CoA kinase
MKIIGLTGGIATGKTTVAHFLEELGAVVIDADQLARDIVAPGSSSLARVVELFGPAVLAPDGSLDRQALRGLVFGDPPKRKQLEAIMHPAIKELALQRLAAARAGGAQVAVYMAPLLIEAGATDRVDEIWVVTLRPEVQRERLMARDRCSREQAEQIIAAQMPLAEKEGYGVVVIDNSSSQEETRQQVQAAWRQRIAG